MKIRRRFRYDDTIELNDGSTVSARLVGVQYVEYDERQYKACRSASEQCMFQRGTRIDWWAEQDERSCQQSTSRCYLSFEYRNKIQQITGVPVSGMPTGRECHYDTESPGVVSRR